MKLYRRLPAVIMLCAVIIAWFFVTGAGGEQAQKQDRGRIITFKDVGTDHWAYGPISHMADRNIVNGYPDGSFRPRKMVSRSEFAALLSSAAGLEIGIPGAGGFADVPEDAWFRPAVETATQYMPGMVERDGRRYFLPRENAAREEVVVALVRALGAGSSYANPSILRDKFTDYDKVDPAFMVPMAWAYQNNLLRGFPDGTLRPRDGISRAEATALLYRAFLVDSSIEGLIAARRIEPLNNSDREYADLVTLLKGKYGSIDLGLKQAYNIEYHAREVDLYDGEGPRVIFVFGGIEPRYHSWEADFARRSETVRVFTGEVAREAARLYPQDTILVVLGHNISFLFDVSGIYEGKYLTRSGEGWRLERFYTGVLVRNGKVAETWSER